MWLRLLLFWYRHYSSMMGGIILLCVSMGRGKKEERLLYLFWRTLIRCIFISIIVIVQWCSTKQRKMVCHSVGIWYCSWYIIMMMTYWWLHSVLLCIHVVKPFYAMAVYYWRWEYWLRWFCTGEVITLVVLFIFYTGNVNLWQYSWCSGWEGDEALSRLSNYFDQ
jgi:hypothetical protein